MDHGYWITDLAASHPDGQIQKSESGDHRIDYYTFIPISISYTIL